MTFTPGTIYYLCIPCLHFISLENINHGRCLLFIPLTKLHQLQALLFTNEFSNTKAASRIAHEHMVNHFFIKSKCKIEKIHNTKIMKLQKE